jgi:hypothetical protein
MTLVARLAAAVLVTLALATSAQGGVKPISGSAPVGLRAFLLRADEPARENFPRTPSFAWSPVRGALRYEFQLSTSNVFSDNGIVYTDANVQSPAVSIPLSLPWITGKPYSLYARVRAVLPKRITPWSAPFGFNMRWPSIPQPLSTYPGLLRWSPVEGATGYDVWLLDAGKVFTVNTNVADQREYYTFHQQPSWITTLHWRVRAVRTLYGTRKNSLPAVSYGPWSPIYTAVNPPFATGAFAAQATVSDVVSDAAVSPAHRLMPAFVFAGNRTLFDSTEELYRVYVFTDSDCVNVVYRGAIVGGPAYAPRQLGPLDLPKTQKDLTAARTTYLKDGDEGPTFSIDGAKVQTTELDKPAATGGGANGAGGAGGNNNGSASPSEGSAATGGQAGAGTSIPVEQTKTGAPVDLWDTDAWPRGGYFWTLVAVEPRPADPVQETVSAVAPRGGTTVTLSSATKLKVGDTLTIGQAANQDTATIVSIAGSTVTLSAPLLFSHSVGEPVLRGERIEYWDLELPQETCAAGRVMRFGKQSEPSLTGSGAPFVSGLSPNGRLTAASRSSTAFYGYPLVAWAPALGAGAYEVQWSKSAYPFRAEADPKTGTAGLTTFATSATLPLKPGTWYYRVRGINFSLPGTANQMSWSNAVKLVVSRPRFVVVR